MSKYPNLQRFARDVIHPFLVGLKHYISQELKYANDLIVQLNTQISNAYVLILSELDNLRINFRNSLTLVQQRFTTLHTTISNSLLTHQSATNNPHQVKLDQIAHLATTTPTALAGTLGDVWIKYESTTPHYQWVEGLWSECSVPCGGGTKSRSVVCKNESGNVVADTNCISTGIPKPATSIICNTQSCGIDANFYVAADNYGEMFRSNASLAKLASLGGIWSGDGSYNNIYGPTTIFFPVGVPVYFYSEGRNNDEEGGASIIFTNVLSNRFSFTLHRVDAGPSPVWITDREWQYNPSLGSRGFLRISAHNTNWKWAFSLTYTG